MTEESIFAAALAIGSPSERAAFLNRVCGTPALRKEIDDLLAAHASSNALDRPPADLARTGAYESEDDGPPAAAVGDRVGPYRLMEQIGEGGFGLVFVAVPSSSGIDAPPPVSSPDQASSSPPSLRSWVGPWSGTVGASVRP